MEIKELKNKTIKDLGRLLKESREKLRELRFKDANKQLKNVREIRILRADISRLLTVLNQKGGLQSDEAKDMVPTENK